jgi:NTE family protein
MNQMNPFFFSLKSKNSSFIIKKMFFLEFKSLNFIHKQQQNYILNIICSQSTLLILNTFLLLFFSTFSQAQETSPRKKIGLVLSGGGAKGFAHIGVLKVLEQQGIKIDYIGGTSMGAVVGGLYACGYSATQIDSIMRDTNFDALLQDYIPRNSKNFYEKQSDDRYALSLPFTGFKVSIPIALSKGLYNFNSLNQLFKNQQNIRDFSKLPIPFVCMATDIETGKEVLLNKGYLPQAILASSAFPTLFSPIEIDGKLLIDGGVSNNYPVEHVRNMGADIIIGIDVQDDLKDRNFLKEATRILVQITNLQMIENMKKKVGKTDIYIKPEVTNYSVISFDDQKIIVQKGEEAAMAILDKLKLLSQSDYKPQLQAKTSDELFLKQLIINDLPNYTRAYIIGKLGFNEETALNYNDIKVGINKLNATQNFSTITYKINKNEKGENIFELNLKENPTRTYLKFGLHYDGLYKTAALLNFTRKRNFFKNDVVSADLILGDNFRYNFDYYIDNGFYWSFGVKSRFSQFNRNVETDFNSGNILSALNIQNINLNFTDLTNQAYVQTVFRQNFLIGLGIEHKHLKLTSETLQNTQPILEKSDYWSVFGNIKLDTFDNKYFPKRGISASADFQSFLYSSNYTNAFNPFSIAKGEFGFATNFFKTLTLKSQTEAGLPIGGRSVSFFDFVLGGYGAYNINNFKHFYGYNFLSLAGDSFIKTTATLDFEFIKKNHLNFAANYAYIQNRLFETTRWISTPRYSGYAIGYGLESILGPVEVKYSWSPETSKGIWFVNVGFWF